MLFDVDFEHSQLTALANNLRDHVERAIDLAHRSLLDGEAVVHTGLMRRYGLLADRKTPFLALDAEARMGFDSLADQQSFETMLSEKVGLPEGADLPRKLDLVAVDHGGSLLLVEVKADATGLVRAAWQAAVHVARFRALIESDSTWFEHILGELARQKARIGLLGRATLPSFAVPPRVVPVLAAPDTRENWLSCWRTEISPILDAAKGHLAHLRLWRLDRTGQVIEDALA